MWGSAISFSLHIAMKPVSFYGNTYGYRSGLNASMVKHLESKANGLLQKSSLNQRMLFLISAVTMAQLLAPTSVVILLLLEWTPLRINSENTTKSDIQLITDFFSAKNFQKALPNRKAKIVTSIAMFYDLEDPIDFAKQVASILDQDGLWVLEQSYLPAMVEAMAYDTVCHEHLEYYALYQIKK